MNDERDVFEYSDLRPGVYGDGGAGGIRGDEGDDLTFKQADIDAAVATAVASHTDKNKTLLDEKKTVQSMLNALQEKWGDLDPSEVKTVMELFANNADAQLIKEGKFDEVLAKRTDKLIAEHTEVVTELNKKIEELETSSTGYKSKYENKVTDVALRQAASGAEVVNTAIDDVVSRGQSIFTVDENGDLEARDKDGNLIKIEDKLLTPALFIEGLKVSAPHYWPGSAGSDAGGAGSGGIGATDIDVRAKDAASRGDMKTFRKLRAEQEKAAKA